MSNSYFMSREHIEKSLPGVSCTIFHCNSDKNLSREKSSLILPLGSQTNLQKERWFAKNITCLSLYQLMWQKHTPFCPSLIKGCASDLLRELVSKEEKVVTQLAEAPNGKQAPDQNVVGFSAFLIKKKVV